MACMAGAGKGVRVRVAGRWARAVAGALGGFVQASKIRAMFVDAGWREVGLSDSQTYGLVELWIGRLLGLWIVGRCGRCGRMGGRTVWLSD